MSVPTITHLQFLVLDRVRALPCPGRLVRAALAEFGQDAAGPAFYQLMDRLEAAGLVAGRYVPGRVNNQTFRERWYDITPAGRAEWEAVRDFYLKVLGR